MTKQLQPLATVRLRHKEPDEEQSRESTTEIVAAAGADILDINFGCSVFSVTKSNCGAALLKQPVLAGEIVKAVRKAVSIPLFVKYRTGWRDDPQDAMDMGRRFEDAGADALVLFNRFYQPDIDVDGGEVVPNLTLSTPADMRLPLRWVAILYGEIEASLALTSGIHSVDDVLKAVMAGADVANVCSVNGAASIVMMYHRKPHPPSPGRWNSTRRSASRRPRSC